VDPVLIAIETLGVIEGADRVFPSDISRDGSTVVGYASHSVNAGPHATRAVAWTAEQGLFSLGFPTQRATRVVAANTDGCVLLVVAERDTSVYDSCLWKAPNGSRAWPKVGARSLKPYATLRSFLYKFFAPLGQRTNEVAESARRAS
jgi:hypothetical protein